MISQQQEGVLQGTGLQVRTGQEGWRAGTTHTTGLQLTGTQQDAWQGLGTRQAGLQPEATGQHGDGQLQAGQHSRATRGAPQEPLQPRAGQQTAGLAGWQPSEQLAWHTAAWGWVGSGQRTGLVRRLLPRGRLHTQAVASWPRGTWVSSSWRPVVFPPRPPLGSLPGVSSGSDSVQEAPSQLEADGDPAAL